ncbi:MAG TPA: glycoside hydrolase domain-containing protein [Streptosporangiaceae bacterium]|nr:glycoside hydrolase domain-containing protein [Streptosporangiaceae bacterium]
MRRVITFAVVLEFTFMAFAGIVLPQAAAGAAVASPARLTARAAPARARPGWTDRATPRRAALKLVRFGGYTFQVPAAWPVYRLDRDPAQCVRYDRHAVYLGRPSAGQQCPAHLVGRTTTISVQPGQAGAAPAGPSFGGPARLAGGPAPGASASYEVRASLPGSGLTITGTYAGRTGGVLSIIRSVRRAAPARRAGRRPDPAQRHPGHRARRGLAQVMTRSAALLAARRGPGKRHHRPRRDELKSARHGFDTCAAPSRAVMRAWYPEFSAAAVYLGGPEAGCAQPNLTASWVRTVTRMGWVLIPTYVGPQASCSRFSVRIRAAHAAAQGRAAARAAARRARRLGMGRGTPIYYDLEAYHSRNARCRTAALVFLGAWTRALHARGYAAGLYSSASSAARDMGAARSARGHRLAKPDSVWFGLWDTGRNVRGLPYLRGAWWRGPHRIKQYLGPHLRTVRGRTVDIDSDWVYGLVYR